MGHLRWFVFFSVIALAFIVPSIMDASAQSIQLTPSESVVTGHNLIIIINISDSPAAPVIVRIENIGPSFIEGDYVDITLDEVGVGEFRGEVLVDFIEKDLTDNIVAARDQDILQVTYDGGSITLTDIVYAALPGTAYPSGERWEFNEDILCPNDPDGNNDSDGDAVCDVWEDDPSGDLVISDSTYGTYTFDCGIMGCGSDRPDVFVEIDYMEGHEPDPDALQLVINAFDNARESTFLREGIRLHLQQDSKFAIHHDTHMPFPGYEIEGSPQYAGFDQIKGNNFGTVSERGQYSDWDNSERKLKHQVFHYVLFVHLRAWYGCQSGIAEIVGNDVMISLGCETAEVGSTDQQAGTLMHELGHNLGLDHGGGDSINNKPNYFSVMTYTRQWSDFDHKRELDFSNMTLGHDHTTTSSGIEALHESNLYDRPYGIDAYPGHRPNLIFSCPDGNMPTDVGYIAGGWIDWGCDGIDGAYQQVEANINNFISWPTEDSEELEGFNDWAGIKYNFAAAPGHYADGRHSLVAGGKSPTTVAPGIPPGETLASLKAKDPNAEADVNFEYKSTEQPEIDLEMATLHRISNLLTLYRTIYVMPSDLFEKGYSGSLVPPYLNSVPHGIMPGSQMTQKDTFKWSFLLAIEYAIEQINLHNLEETKDVVSNINKDLGMGAIPSTHYKTIQPTLENIALTYDAALDFKPTSIHTTHQPLSNPIIDQTLINNFVDDVQNFANTLPSTDLDNDGILDVYDFCPNNSGPVSEKGCPVTPQKPTKYVIPNWIKINAGWWCDNQISEKEFADGIEYLINEGIIKTPQVQITSQDDVIPQWIKNNACWWADGLISDNDFGSGIDYLVNQGIIKLKI